MQSADRQESGSSHTSICSSSSGCPARSDDPSKGTEIGGTVPKLRPARASSCPCKDELVARRNQMAWMLQQRRSEDRRSVPDGGRNVERPVHAGGHTSPAPLPAMGASSACAACPPLRGAEAFPIAADALCKQGRNLKLFDVRPHLGEGIESPWWSTGRQCAEWIFLQH